MLILIADAFDKQLPEKLRVFGDVTDDCSRQAEADVVLIRSKTKCTKDYIDAAPKLKLIIRGGVGLDNVDKEYAASKGITVRNTPEASSIAVAELAFALMISAPNHIIRGHNGMAAGNWLKKEIKRTELYGKTLGLLGIGRIASEVAIRAKAFGMKVIAYDKFVESSPHAELVSFDNLLGQADYVSLHMPLTDETRGMLNKEALSKMKDGVIIVNTGRGKCIDEADMVTALRSGKVAVYATDVWSSDPPPADCPLVGEANVLMTPHIGASSKENLLRIGIQVEEIIREFVGQ